MKITLGKITRTKERFPGDKLAHQTADLLIASKVIGCVHDNGYAPQWAYHINPYRWQPGNGRYAEMSSDSRSPFHGLLFDGAAFDSPETARARVESQLTKFEELKATSRYLTRDERTALREFAKANGRYWKAALRHFWETGAGQITGTLQMLRNASYFGPVGLIRVKPVDFS